MLCFHFRFFFLNYSGEKKYILAGHEAPVMSVSISNDNTVIVSASMDKNLCLWTTEKGKLIRTLSGHTEGILCVEFTNDDDSSVIVRTYDYFSQSLDI